METKIDLHQPTDSNYRLHGLGHCLETKLSTVLLASCSDNPTTVFKIVSFSLFFFSIMLFSSKYKV